MKPMPTIEIEPISDVFCQELASIDHMGGAGASDLYRYQKLRR